PDGRHVPPIPVCFSTPATLRPTVAAPVAAPSPPVPAPITTTSYSVGINRKTRRVGDPILSDRLAPGLPAFEGRERDECRRRGTRRLGIGRGLIRIEPGYPRAELAMLITELPVGFGEPLEAFCDP